MFRFDLKAFAGVDKDLLIAKMAIVVEEAANGDDRCIDDAKELIKLFNAGAVRPKTRANALANALLARAEK